MLIEHLLALRHLSSLPLVCKQMHSFKLQKELVLTKIKEFGFWQTSNIWVQVIDQFQILLCDNFRKCCDQITLELLF